MLKFLISNLSGGMFKDVLWHVRDRFVRNVLTGLCLSLLMLLLLCWHYDALDRCVRTIVLKGFLLVLLQVLRCFRHVCEDNCAERFSVGVTAGVTML